MTGVMGSPTRSNPIAEELSFRTYETNELDAIFGMIQLRYGSHFRVRSEMPQFDSSVERWAESRAVQEHERAQQASKKRGVQELKQERRVKAEVSSLEIRNVLSTNNSFRKRMQIRYQ